MSRIQLPDCSKLATNRKKIQWHHNLPTWCHHQIFWRCFLSIVKLSYSSKFHVNIITGSWVMTTLFYKGLTKNPEIGNTPVWVFPDIGRLRQFRNTNFGKNVSNKMLLNAAKWQGYSIYYFWVIKGKPTRLGQL